MPRYFTDLLHRSLGNKLEQAQLKEVGWLGGLQYVWVNKFSDKERQDTLSKRNPTLSARYGRYPRQGNASRQGVYFEGDRWEN